MPGDDAAFEVDQFRVAESVESFSGLTAAVAGAAVEQQGFVFGEVGEFGGYVFGVEIDFEGVGDFALGDFARGAEVDEERIRTFDKLSETVGIDLFNICGGEVSDEKCY